MIELLIATNNTGKINEFKQAFAALPNYNIVTLEKFPDIIEPLENGLTIEDNSMIKAKSYFKQTGIACLADDTGLEVDCLGGKPGVLSARFAGINASYSDNNNLLLELMKNISNRSARFKTVLTYIDGDKKIITVKGYLEGEIINDIRGINGFGYDPLFYLPSLGKTLAEISIKEKNQLSHRSKALASLIQELKFKGC